MRFNTGLGPDDAQMAIRVPQKLRTRIEKAAEAERRASLSEFLRNLISDALDARENHAA